MSHDDNGPYKLKLTDSNTDGLDFMQKLYELDVELDFKTWNDVEEFESFLNTHYSDEKREEQTYRAKPELRIEAVVSDQT